jgi:FHS family L-fucose permease-like MFS transporter
MKNMFRSANGRSYALTFLLVCSLFLLWGFCNGMIDVLNKHFQNSLSVTKAQSALVQFANYMGYFFMALPAGLLARRFGYRGGILVGLVLIAIGAFWFIPAVNIGTYWAFLTGLFILATGLTCLETVANPYATVLGPAETGAARINFAQTTNGIGWILGPLVGGHFILSSTGEANRSNSNLYIPYLIVGIAVSLLVIVFAFAPVPEVQDAGDRDAPASGKSAAPGKPLWSNRHFSLAVAAQFLYVAAQTGIFSFFINYVVADMPQMGAGLASLLPAKWSFSDGASFHVTELGASQLLSFGGFGLFLVGRLTGSFALRLYRPDATLALYGLANTVLMVLVMLPLGWISVAGLFLSFFFMSIMFPTIFALGIHRLGAETKRASSFIVMSIVGGAIMPLFMGWLADRFSMRAGFLMPLICFVGVAVYAANWRKLVAGDPAAESAAPSAR